MHCVYAHLLRMWHCMHGHCGNEDIYLCALNQGDLFFILRSRFCSLSTNSLPQDGCLRSYSGFLFALTQHERYNTRFTNDYHTRLGSSFCILKHNKYDYFDVTMMSLPHKQLFSLSCTTLVQFSTKLLTMLSAISWLNEMTFSHSAFITLSMCEWIVWVKSAEMLHIKSNSYWSLVSGMTGNEINWFIMVNCRNPFF